MNLTYLCSISVSAALLLNYLNSFNYSGGFSIFLCIASPSINTCLTCLCSFPVMSVTFVFSDMYHDSVLRVIFAFKLNYLCIISMLSLPYLWPRYIFVNCLISALSCCYICLISVTYVFHISYKGLFFSVICVIHLLSVCYLPFLCIIALSSVSSRG